MMVAILLLIIGFLMLVKSADFLIEGSTSLAKKLKISQLVVGLTVVAFGTSAPELFVNIIASVKGISGITIGNILGSNIFNVFLILGISSLIFPLIVNKGTVYKQIPFTILSVLVLAVLVNDFIFTEVFFLE